MIPYGTKVLIRGQPEVPGGLGCPHTGIGSNPPAGQRGEVVGHSGDYNLVAWEPTPVDGAPPHVYPVLNYLDQHLQVAP